MNNHTCTEKSLKYREVSTGHKQYVWQCLECGQVSNAIRHSSLTIEQKKQASMVSTELQDNWFRKDLEWRQEEWKKKLEERDRIWEENQVDKQKEYERKRIEAQIKKERADKKWWQEYNQYLRSPQWHLKRDAVFRRDGYVCKACESRPAQQVHHLTYDHVFDEPLFDLVSVCVLCHEKITDMGRKKQSGR